MNNKKNAASKRKVNKAIKIYALFITGICISMGLFSYTMYKKYINTVTENQKHNEEAYKKYSLLEENYNTLLSRYDSMNDTIGELSDISLELDKENKKLLKQIRKQNKRIKKFQKRQELLDKYEYALYQDGSKTDITFDQLITLEKLLKKSKIKDQDLILSWILAESGGDETCTSTISTAKGYAQFLDGTSEFVYVNLMGNDKNTWYPNIVYDGEISLKMMVTFIDYLYDKNDGDLYEILRDYRGKQDITGYISMIDDYLKNANKSVAEIASLLN